MNRVFITIISILFFTMAAVFATFPRSTYSELERRELATFPTFSLEKLQDGSFTSEVSAWWSDSEPYRDVLMTMSMTVKQYSALHLGNDDSAIVFHASDSEAPAADAEATPLADEDDNRTIADFEGGNMADENAKIASAGIIIVGSGANVRALNAFGGTPQGSSSYAETANSYKEIFGNSVNIYCMVIPISTEFYLPEKAKKMSRPQLPVIRDIYSHLRRDVKAVDCYTPLSQHVNEDIYLRTDHHWAPLGAYYAAQKFAHVAGVPFKDLSNYDKRVVRNYVGTMYGFSHDISLKNAPEDFVYYEPRGIAYSTSYVNYSVSKGFNITRESAPTEGPFFYHLKDGNSNAYGTFMGGDTKITTVRTATKNGRRLIILKDSFGNALPGYLFYSFEEIHVIDTRYFNKNMRQYVASNRITDILFANNIYKAYTGGSARACLRFLDQANGHAPATAPAEPRPAEKPKEKKTPKAETVKETPVKETPREEPAPQAPAAADAPAE